MPSEQDRTLVHQTATVVLVTLAIVGSLVILYAASSAVFLIFGGLLLAAIFRALALPLEKLGLSKRIAWPLVIVVFFLLIFAGITYGGAQIVSQYNELWNQLQSQLRELGEMLGDMGINLAAGEGEEISARSLLPDPSGILSSASTAVFTALGAFGNVFIAIFIALFFMAQPGLYLKGFVSLFPPARRRRLDQVLHKATHTLVMWVCGTGISMLTIFAVTWIGLAIIGMSNAFLLAFQAGLLAFIPTLGPFIAGVPIILVGLAESATLGMLGLGVYVLIQAIESNVTTPIAQRMTSTLPPALTLSAQLVFGVLFGLSGVIFAVPIVAVLMTITSELYVKDTLGGAYRDAEE